jgi:hypothetical protein
MSLLGRYTIGFLITSLVFFLIALIVQAEELTPLQDNNSSMVVATLVPYTENRLESPSPITALDAEEVLMFVRHMDNTTDRRQVATTTTISTITPYKVTSEDDVEVPYLIDQLYGYYEKGNHIKALQELLGMEQVDGVYGRNTRKTHMAWFGSNTEALHHFNDRNQWYIEAIDPEPADEYLGQYWLDRPTLGELVDEHFKPEHRSLFLKIAFCESSAQPEDTFNDAVSPALAVGAFQHMARYWRTRSEDASMKGWDIFDMKAQVKVASHLFYTSGIHHWNPSRKCWG